MKILLFFLTGCQTIKQKTDAIVEKENIKLTFVNNKYKHNRIFLRIETGLCLTYWLDKKIAINFNTELL